jgi:hypothetical protein
LRYIESVTRVAQLCATKRTVDNNMISVMWLSLKHARVRHTFPKEPGPLHAWKHPDYREQMAETCDII